MTKNETIITDENRQGDSIVRRVRFYGANDFALYTQTERLTNVLSKPEFNNNLSLIDAVELHECWFSINCGFRHPNWDEKTYSKLIKAAKTAKGTACRIIRSMGDTSMLDAINDLNFNYIRPFWRLVEASGYYKELDAERLIAEQNGQCEHIRSIMTSKTLVDAYAPFIKNWLIDHPLDSLPLVLSAGKGINTTEGKLTLPKTLTNSDLNTIVSHYLTNPGANRNYLSVLSNKNAFNETGLSLSPRMRAQIDQANNKALEELFNQEYTSHFGYGICIELSDDQTACRKCAFDGKVAKFTYSRIWLEKYFDNATILNNLAFVLEFLDARGNLQTTSWRHKDRSLLSLLGVHLANEYPNDFSANIDDMRQTGILQMYSTLLRQNGTRIETAIEWYYNEYILENFGIKGFRIDLPGEDYSPMDKCSLISIQIERVLKVFTMLARDGEIMKEQYRHEMFGGFHNIPSSLDAPKYAYGIGEECSKSINILFEQRLSFNSTSTNGPREASLFELMTEAPLTDEELDDYALHQVNWLIEKSLAKRNEKNLLSITSRTLALKNLQDEGFISLSRLEKQDMQVVDGLRKDGYLTYEASLFSKHEADYMSYIFDNRKYSNAQGLRNVYDHASDIENDPHSNTHIENYMRLLIVLVDVTLKINDEFVLKYGNKGDIDFIDWPFDATEAIDLQGLID